MCASKHEAEISFEQCCSVTTGLKYDFFLFVFSRDWWHSPVTLLRGGKNCGMTRGCHGLYRADRRISVAALRLPCQGKADRGQKPMTTGMAQLHAATQSSSPRQHSQTQFTIMYLICNLPKWWIIIS